MAASTEGREPRCNLASLCGLLALAGCIDTHVEEVALALPCSVQAAPDSAAEALVWIRVDLKEEGYRYCSAVAIAPRLVLTLYSCVAHPAELEPELTSGEPSRFPVDRATYYDPVERDEFCDTAQGWSVIEDGSLRSRLSAPVRLADIGVGRAGSVPRPTLTVDELLVAGSSDRCTEGIAVLILADELQAVPLPLRLEGAAQVGDAVLTSSVVPEQGFFVRRDVPSVVQQLTAEQGDELVPPQSLLLAASSCYLSRGGAVFAEASGALVGLISSGQSRSCEDVGAGNTTALLLAPYRALLLEAASSYGQTLYSERPRGSATDTPECGSGAAPP